MSMFNKLGFVLNGIVFNDAATKIESIRDQLHELSNQATNIQLQADAENRSLLEEEIVTMNNIWATFGNLEEDIKRREKLEQMNMVSMTKQNMQNEFDEGSEPVVTEPTRARMSAPANTGGTAAAAAARAAIPNVGTASRVTVTNQVQPNAGRGGFSSFGQFAQAVFQSKSNPANTDARLIRMTSSTYGNEGTGADGGFAVPPDFREPIMQKVMGEDSLLSRCDRLITGSNAVTQPVDETTPWQSSGGIQAYWTNEAATITRSKPSLRTVTHRLEKLAALVDVTEELLEDATGLASHIRAKVPEKFTAMINSAIINGTGAGQPLGLLNSSALVTVSKESGQAADTIRMENITKMFNRLYAPLRSRAAWYVNQDIEQQLQTMSFPGTGTAVPVYLPPGGLSATPYATLLGRPVIPIEACSALGDVGDIILADLSQYRVLLKAGQMRQDVSIHLNFDQDISSFRFIMRVGGHGWWNSAITRQNGSNTLSCFVTLEAR